LLQRYANEDVSVGARFGDPEEVQSNTVMTYEATSHQMQDIHCLALLTQYYDNRRKFAGFWN